MCVCVCVCVCPSIHPSSRSRLPYEELLFLFFVFFTFHCISLTLVLFSVCMPILLIQHLHQQLHAVYILTLLSTSQENTRQNRFFLYFLYPLSTLYKNNNKVFLLFSHSLSQEFLLFFGNHVTIFGVFVYVHMFINSIYQHDPVISQDYFNYISLIIFWPQGLALRLASS